MTDLTSSSRQARWTRSAISPRLAIRIFLNIAAVGDGLRGRRSGLFAGGALASFDDEQGLAEFDRFPVLAEDFADDPGRIGLDLVHDLHGFDDADRLAHLDGAADLDERIRARARRTIEGTDHRRLD